MKNTFVIVNYNDSETTIKLLENIKDYKIIDKIVIVDNKSTDDSLKRLGTYSSKKVIILESDDNKGYSYALNIGAKYLIDLYNECNIIFSNADIVIDKEDDIKELLTHLNNSNVIVAPNIVDSNSISRGWIIPKPMDEVVLNIPFLHRKYFNKHLKYSDTYYDKKISKVDTVSGCFFLMTSKHYKDINGFDENVFLYYEENIFGIKTKKLNKNIIVVNDIDVYHEHSISIDKSLKRLKKYKIQKQSQRYFEKHYNNANIIEMLLLYITYYIAKVILFFKYLFN